jgi:hypothetical protein
MFTDGEGDGTNNPQCVGDSVVDRGLAETEDETDFNHKLGIHLLVKSPKT